MIESSKYKLGIFQLVVIIYGDCLSALLYYSHSKRIIWLLMGMNIKKVISVLLLTVIHYSLNKI